MDEATDTAPLVTALRDLRHVISACSFSLSADKADERRAERDHLRREIDGLIARISSLGSPLLVVVGGVTGSGKSTIVNTLVGRAVSRTGVIRPTTESPVLIVHPVDAHWFTDDRVLAEFVRVEREGRKTTVDTDDETARLQLIRDEDIPLGLALVDAPDIDSLSVRNRAIADALLDAADVWLWCTSAAKYADQESMRYLARAGARRTALAVALTRVDLEHVDELAGDFREKLAERASIEPELFTVETARVIDERLPRPAVGSIERWLRELSGPLVRRSRRRQTMEGALDIMSADVAGLIAWVADETGTLGVLSDVINRTIAQSRHDFGNALDDGRAMRDEVLLRWNRFAGTSGMLALVERAGERASAWARSLMGALSGERAEEEEQVREAVAIDVASLATQLLDLASGRIVTEWGTIPAGKELLEANPELAEAPPDLEVRTRKTVDEWQSTVVRLVETKGAKRRLRARWLTAVINATATGAIIATLAQTGGLTGAEAGIATAAGAANQALLTRVLGAANMRWLISSARADLERRFTELLAVHRRRFTEVLAAAAPSPKLIAQLEERADAVQKVRSCLN
ncbi:MAG: dynamin family protein [Actinobacteria bacterium]|nr:dynamin family protein [Actinomycetota bacterium]